MRNVVLYIAMSLDGYIADANGGVDWLMGDGSAVNHEGTYPAFYETIDTILLGYTTYHQIKEELFPQGWPYEGKRSYVWTHKQLPSIKDVTFVQEDMTSFLHKLRHEDGKDIWICGGSTIVNQAIKEDLIDRYHITIIPTILGDGVSLFEKHPVAHQLSLVETLHYNGMVDIIYEKRITKG